MHDDEPALSIVWRQIGRKRWKQEEASSLEEALERAQALDNGQHEVLLYENIVRFEHDDEERQGSVLFWWSRTFNETMEGEPVARGTGWSDDVEAFVDYAVPMPVLTLDDDDRRAHEALRFTSDDEELILPEQASREPASRQLSTAAAPHARYAEVDCYACERIIPQNEAIDDVLEVRTGRSSGTASYGRSSGMRSGYSSRGSSASYSSRSSSRVTSGRSYYASERVFFCSVECQFAEQSKAVKDKPALEQIAFYGAEFFKRLTRG